MEKNQTPDYIIGLGNPGSKYSKTYHNIGRFFADQFLSLNANLAQPKLIQVFTPVGFMNETGQEIAKFSKEKKILPSQILVIHDDSDQPIGQYKFVFASGSGGHKGVEGLISHLKTNEFHRLKIGIRPKSEVIRRKAGDFVLKKWSQKQESAFLKLVSQAWSDPRNPLQG